MEWTGLLLQEVSNQVLYQTQQLKFWIEFQKWFQGYLYRLRLKVDEE